MSAADPTPPADLAGGEARTPPPLRVTVSKVVYSTCYFTSYMTVFPMLWAVSLIPRESAAGQGLRDGSRGARESVADITARWSAGSSEQRAS